MCTVTVIPLDARGGGTRLACNRDESHRRPPAESPRIQRFGARQAILPIDPVSGGTWIAVNDAGLILTLLNVYPPAENGGTPLICSSESHQSRGIIIPALLHLDCAEEVADRFGALVDVRRFPPFRLVAVDEVLVADVRGGGGGVSVRRTPRDGRPLLFTSSGLGDPIVERPRRALFEETFAGSGADAVRQDAYHRHSWPQRRDVSVCMFRDKARTVSYTVVEVRGDAVSLRYHPEAPDAAAEDVALMLPRVGCRP